MVTTFTFPVTVLESTLMPTQSSEFPFHSWVHTGKWVGVSSNSEMHYHINPSPFISLLFFFLFLLKSNNALSTALHCLLITQKTTGKRQEPGDDLANDSSRPFTSSCFSIPLCKMRMIISGPIPQMVRLKALKILWNESIGRLWLLKANGTK